MSDYPSDEAGILNVALDLALEWGKDWLMPIPDRLRERYPTMTREEAERWDARCREIMEYVFRECRGASLENIEAVSDMIAGRYPLLNESNVGRLTSQGIYYAMK